MSLTVHARVLRRRVLSCAVQPERVASPINVRVFQQFPEGQTSALAQLKNIHLKKPVSAITYLLSN